MTELRSDFLRTLQARGYIHQATDLAALDALAVKEPVVAYVGYDATADSLHVGHLVSIMMLRRMKQTGHKPIVLMGGGTTKIGDPSFRDESRPLLDDAAIEGNIAEIRKTFEHLVGFADGQALLVNNADWLDRLAYIPFLRDVGMHFTINRMLSFDSVKLRLEREQPLTFLEFNYMILQAYDFLELFRRHGCRLQMGGSDQWGNIVNGVELARRIAGAELYGLTTPLITTASGAKMGKTAAGAVWLSEKRLSAWDYWQFWRNTEDADVGRFLRLFTDLPLDEIARLEALDGAEINEAKKILANEATACATAQQAALKRRRDRTPDLRAGRRLRRPADHRGRPRPPGRRRAALRAAEGAGLAASNGEARRLIKGGGARINDVAIAEPRTRSWGRTR